MYFFLPQRAPDLIHPFIFFKALYRISKWVKHRYRETHPWAVLDMKSAVCFPETEIFLQIFLII